MDKQGVIPTFMPLPSRSIILTSVAFTLLCTLYISKSPHGCHRIYHILGNAASLIPTPAPLLLHIAPRANWSVCMKPRTLFSLLTISQSACAVSYRRCLSCSWAAFCNSFLHNPCLRPDDFNGAIHVSGGCKFRPLGCKFSGA